jgi:hypothetical protein
VSDQADNFSLRSHADFLNTNVNTAKTASPYEGSASMAALRGEPLELWHRNAAAFQEAKR